MKKLINFLGIVILSSGCTHLPSTKEVSSGMDHPARTVAGDNNSHCNYNSVQLPDDLELTYKKVSIMILPHCAAWHTPVDLISFKISAEDPVPMTYEIDSNISIDGLSHDDTLKAFAKVLNSESLNLSDIRLKLYVALKKYEANGRTEEDHQALNSAILNWMKK